MGESETRLQNDEKYDVILMISRFAFLICLNNLV